jgi:hypothetical protein
MKSYRKVRQRQKRPCTNFPANLPSKQSFMYLSLRHRFSIIVHEINEELLDIAMEPRLMPGVVAEMRSIRSSASTPSLRSRDGAVTPTMGGLIAPGGNVRVVVRVRGFLPRGRLHVMQLRYMKALG